MKKSVAALLASAALMALALPALAAPPPPPAPPAPEPAPAPVVSEAGDSFNEGYVIYQLAAQGVTATGVEEWGDYLRAFVVGEDGRQTMQLLHRDTLKPVNS